ncbi:MAG: very short patch repair endonuclease [Arcobacter sp.]|nr:very short patch repair endonuclease [Arcobacter sp.]
MDTNIAKLIRSSGTKIELKLAKAMWTKGLRYRKQCKDVYGKPDFCFKGLKLAIFCDSDFWHGKKYLNGQNFKSNIEYWEKKILRNLERDKEVNEKLATEGWTVLRFWEKEINKEIDTCIEEIIETRKRLKDK